MLKKVLGFALFLLMSSSVTAAMKQVPLEITPTGHLATPQLLIPEQESDIQAFFAKEANQAFTVEPLIPTSMGFSLVHATINDTPVKRCPCSSHQTKN